MIYNRQNVFPEIYNNICGAISLMIAQNPTILNDKRYYLFYFILENFSSNLTYLSSYNYSHDSLGFIPIRRNLRISFEAFLDLFNLCASYENREVGTGHSYLHVLQYNHTTTPKPEDLNFLNIQGYKGVHPYNGHFTIVSKMNIFKRNGYSFNMPEGIDVVKYITSYGNEAIHPDVFVETITDIKKKQKMLNLLLRIDFMILYYSYEKICAVLNSGQYPKCNLNCTYNCKTCMNKLYDAYRSMIDNITDQLQITPS